MLIVDLYPDILEEYAEPPFTLLDATCPNLYIEVVGERARLFTHTPVTPSVLIKKLIVLGCVLPESNLESADLFSV